MRLRFSPLAEMDLEAIGDFIAMDSPKAAESFLDRILERCIRITLAPSGGRPRNDLAKGLRSVPFQRYVIFYDVIDDAVQVQRILHGARDISRAFDSDLKR